MILASQSRVRQPNPGELFELALTTLSWELSKLIFVEGEESFDPSEGGPLNGLWPDGVPSEFVTFNKAPVLNLRLHKTSFEGNIPPASCEEEIRHVQGGRAAEPLETEMDVRGVGDQASRNPTADVGTTKIPTNPLTDREDVSRAQVLPKVNSPVESLSSDGIGCNLEYAALTFESVQERDRAIDMIWDDAGPLFRLPYDVDDCTTLRVPAFAVSAFARNGLRFQISRSFSSELAGVSNAQQARTSPSGWTQGLGFYRPLCALTFETVDARDLAIDMIWDAAGPLFRLPYDVDDWTTLIVPQQAVDFFTKRGLKTEQRLVSTSNQS